MEDDAHDPDTEPAGRYTQRISGGAGGVLRKSAFIIMMVGSQASVAVAFPVFETDVFAGQSNVTSIGHVIIGGTSSITTMVRLQVAVFPQSSVAVHVLVTL